MLGDKFWNPKTALKKSLFRLFLNGGGGGIRTHGTLARTTVFKTAPINRSGTPPKILNWLLANHTQKKNYCKGGKLFF